MISDDAKLKYLIRELRRLSVEMHKKDVPTVSLCARREACILQLNLMGYTWNHDTLEAEK